jgi:hypothetical protein
LQDVIISDVFFSAAECDDEFGGGCDFLLLLFEFLVGVGVDEFVG